MAKKNTKGYLMDVVGLRLLLILLLVMYHSFSIVNGWHAPAEGFEDIPAYRWFAWFAHSFRIQALTFISGLLFGYIMRIHPERMSFSYCVVKKIKRIILPSIIFSTLYYLLFSSAPLSVKSLLPILNGAGHLWYLPMLFGCFVIAYALEMAQSKLSNEKCEFEIIWQEGVIVSIFAAIATNNIYDIKVHLFRTTYFFLFFYLGYCVQKKGLRFQVRNKWHLLLTCLLAIVLFVASKTLVFNTDIVGRVAQKTIQLGACLLTIASCYSIANLSTVKTYLQKDYLAILSGYCYGVYVYHQFIIVYLYDKTLLVSSVPDVWVPWICSAITLVASLLLCHLTLKTRIGRYLIG